MLIFFVLILAQVSYIGAIVLIRLVIISVSGGSMPDLKKEIKKSELSVDGSVREDFDFIGFEDKDSNLNSTEDLYNGLESFIKNNDAYTIKKTDDGFELTKRDSKDASKEVKIFKMEDGHCKFGLPIDDEVLKLYFKANLKKDIIVNKCETVEAAIELAKVAKDSGVKISFNRNVLDSLVEQQNQKGIKPEDDVLAKLKAILETDDISHETRHKLR